LAVVAAFGVVAPAAHASLTVPSRTFTSLSAFEAAAGGADNDATLGQRGGGFRHLTWDGIALDGSDPGSTVIRSGRVAAVARSRAQPWGLVLGPNVAVANDGFASVNSNAGFAASSPPNEWAPFNMNTTEWQIVTPTGQTSTPVPALTRGLGVVFLHAAASGTTIQYFNGQTPLGEATAPGGPTSFVGMLFDEPVVTRVVITLGAAAMFNLDGSPGAANPVAGDDVLLAEPGAGEPTVSATAGVPVSPVLASFSDTTSGLTAAAFRAAIDWGDGTRGIGTITSGSGGVFSVSGSHAYAQAGSYTASVTVDDFSGSELMTQALAQVAPRATTTSLTCSPAPVAVTATTNCVATVSDAAGAGASTPSGVLAFSTTTPGATFAQDTGCLLGPTAVAGVASCAVQFTPADLPPAQAHVSVAYGGDAAHAASTAAATVGVRPQRCSLRTLTRKLRPAGLGVLVTCDARANVQIGVRALAARRGRLRAFQLQFGTLRKAVTAGRPTVLTIKPKAGVLRSLHAALRRGQHVSLRLTVTASSHGTSKTTTTRVAAIRIV
jgi:hypothetical protein